MKIHIFLINNLGMFDFFVSNNGYILISGGYNHFESYLKNYELAKLLEMLTNLSRKNRSTVFINPWVALNDDNSVASLLLNDVVVLSQFQFTFI